MIARRPRFADAWEALHIVAGKMATLHAGKPVETSWRAIVADWAWVLTHEGAPASLEHAEARIAASRASEEHAHRELLSRGIQEAWKLQSWQRLMLDDVALAFLEKYELLAAIAWHEARRGPDGRTMIALVTDINIAMGARPRGLGIPADPAPAVRPIKPPATPAELPTPAAPRPALVPEPQQARLI